MSHAPGDIVAIAGNRYSGSRENAGLVDALIVALRARGFEPVTMWDKAELASRAADPAFVARCRCVVAAGGDGTVLHVLSAETTLPLLHFPLGTENLFARNFGVTADPLAAAAMIERGRTRTIDLGLADGRPFACVASAGFDADVVRRLDAWRSSHRDAATGALRRVRRLSYLRPMTAATLRYRFPTILARTAEGLELRGTQVFVQNIPQYGLGFNVCPDAVCDDGLLDFIVCDAPGPVRMIRLALAARRAKHFDLPWVHAGRTTELTLAPANPTDAIPLETDGDTAGLLPTTLRCAPAAQQVIVP